MLDEILTVCMEEEILIKSEDDGEITIRAKCCCNILPGKQKALVTYLQYLRHNCNSASLPGKGYDKTNTHTLNPQVNNPPFCAKKKTRGRKTISWKAWNWYQRCKKMYKWSTNQCHSENPNIMNKKKVFLKRAPQTVPFFYRSIYF